MSRVRIKTLYLPAMLLSASSGQAGQVHELGGLLNTPVGQRYTREYADCYDSTVTGLHRFECAVDEAWRQDGRLNIAYRQTVARLTKAKAAGLKQFQRKWILVRDRKCHSMGLDFHEFDPGDDTSPNPWCYLDETIRRTIWLEKLH